MNYTPFSHLTVDELIREVCNKEDPTDLELELMERLIYWTEYAQTLEESDVQLRFEEPELHQEQTRRATKYKEVA